MIDFAWLVWNSLMYGAVLSLLLCVVILGSVVLNPEIWVNDYPPDIRRKFGPIGERAKKQRSIVAIFFLLILFGLLALSILVLYRAGAGQPGFVGVFLNTWIILMVFNLVDLLVLDWLIFVRIRPRFVVLPGTEGMKGYDDYAFHFKGFLIGTVFSLLASLLLAGIVVLAVTTIA